jgi:hypothetical protein
MAQIIESIDVNVPVSTSYNQWTQFETFPKFLNFVESIVQIDETHTHWKVKIGGAEREFDAVITEQHADERVAWNSTGGDENHAGVVTFHKLSDTTSRVSTGSPPASSRRPEPPSASTTTPSRRTSRTSRSSSSPRVPRPAPGAETSRTSSTRSRLAALRGDQP